MIKRKVLSLILSLVMTIGFSSKVFAIDNTNLGSVDTDKVWTITLNKNVNYYSAKDNIKIIDERGKKINTTIIVAQNFVYVLPPNGEYKEGKYTLDINNSLTSISKYQLKNSVKKEFVVKKQKSGGKIGTAPATFSKDVLLDKYGDIYVEGMQPVVYTIEQLNSKYEWNKKYTNESFEIHFRIPYNQNFVNQINNEKGKLIISSDKKGKNKIEMSVHAENKNGETIITLNGDHKSVFPRGEYYAFLKSDDGTYVLDEFSYYDYWYYNEEGLKVFMNLSYMWLCTTIIK